MQTKKIIPVLLSLFISVTTMAQLQGHSSSINDTRPTSFEVALSAGKTATSFNLFISNPGNKKLKVEINHRGMGAVVDTVITCGQFSQRYNMEEAEDGHYVITVCCGKKRSGKK